jgi:hypothetical protein
MTHNALESQLLTVLREQRLPLTAAQLSKQLPQPAKSKVITAALDNLSRCGQLYAFTQGKGTAFTLKPPLDLSADALAEIIAAESNAVLPAKLKSSLANALRPWFDEALARLIVQGRAYWLPKGKQRLVQAEPVRPSDLLSAKQRTALSTLLIELNRRRRTPRTLDQFLAWLDDDSTLSPSSQAPVPTLTQLIEWYALDRATTSASMLEIPHTWKRYQAWSALQGQTASTELFRDALQQFYNENQIALEPCERPQDLDREQRALLVPLALGPAGFYWRPVHA